MESHERRSTQLLLDTQALRELAYRYARGVDRRDAALLRSVYWEDARDEHGTFFNGPAMTFVDVCMKVVAGFEITRHCIGNTAYAVQGDEAEGELYLEAYHRIGGSAPSELIVSGRYLDRYQRRGGEWRILHRICVVDATSTRPLSADYGRRIEEIGPRGSSSAEDPSRTFFRMLGASKDT
jgi:hypothetical protein